MNEYLSASQLFKFANFIALVSWVTLILVPRKPLTKKWVRSGRVSLVLAVGYWFSISTMLFVSIPPGASFQSLEGVSLFFSSDWGLLAGWIHYLAFDLLIGIYVLKRIENSHFLTRALVLFMIFMLGPIGWSLSRLVRKGEADDFFSSAI